MVDATKRPLQIPPRFMPYLEKHQIYRLFHYLASQLVIQRPDDHILFFKNLLTEEGKSWNRLRIILLGAPYIDKAAIAEYVSFKTGAVMVIAEEIHSQIAECRTILEAVKKVLCTQPVLDNGWILFDFPTTGEEGQAIKDANILPTHVIHLMAPKPEEDLSLCVDGSGREQQLAEYKQHIGALRKMFRHIIKECEVGDQDDSSLPESCLKLIQVLKHAGEAMLPRVALIGPKGSGKKTQAKLLRERFGLIVVDWKALVEETLIREDKLGETVRQAKAHRLEIFPPVAISILEDRLLCGDCQRKGWVLTGFHEGEVLNALSTPPNRFILFEVDAETSKKRVTSRRVNVYTGERYNVDSKLPQGKEANQLRTHPNDILDPLYNEIHMFLTNFKRIRESCGKNVIVVDASQSVRNVFEMVCAAIMRPSPTSKSHVPDAIASNQSLISIKNSDQQIML